jgi:KUP system potassium uptake protein
MATAASPSDSAASEAKAPSAPTLSGTVALAALGVVFGDIGTSPLYTFKTCFTTAHVDASAPNVFGIASALVWTLILVVCFKYVTFVMQVDYRGEGGIFALLARVMPAREKGVYAPLTFFMLVGVIGGATLLGDGIITPAISVLSAVEGLNTLSTEATRWEVPITVAILIGLFIIQWRGTEKVGVIFGPVMGAWFLCIAIAGGIGIAADPRIIWAIDPRHAIYFLTHHGLFGFLLLGATVLCVTGVEALYADMSHFGRRPITFAWYAIVFPALVLNYLGQGASVLANPKALDNAFFGLATGWTLVPMILLATAATVIASQALISGAFTIIEQGIALNLVPRMRVVHTSNRYPGQVYVPAMNVVLGIGTITLVVIFKTSDALASAYGLAVSLTMAATTILYAVVIGRVLHWNRWVVALLFTLFIIMDGAFVLAGLAKIPTGGWVPLAIGAVLTVLATTWFEGRRRVAAAISSFSMPVAEFKQLTAGVDTKTIEGTAVFFTANPVDIPYILHHHWTRLQVLHERVVLLTIVAVNEPYVSAGERVSVERVSDALVRVQARFGFMELPELRPVTEACGVSGLQIDGEDTAYVIASPKIVGAEERGFSALRRWLFDVMMRLAGTLPRDLHIPANQLIEVGVEVRL